MKHHNIINVVDKAYLKHDVDLIIYLIHIAYFYFKLYFYNKYVISGRDRISIQINVIFGSDGGKALDVLTDDDDVKRCDTRCNTTRHIG